MEKPWKALVEAMDYPSIFTSYEYMHNAWKHLGKDDQRLLLIVIRENQKIIGICPLYTYSSRLFLKKVSTISLIGWFEGDCPAIIGNDQECLWHFLFEILKNDITFWNSIRLNEHPPEDTTLTTAFEKDNGYTLKEFPFSIRYLSDVSTTYDVFFQKLSKSSKRYIRRKHKQNAAQKTPFTIQKHIGMNDPVATERLLDRYLNIEKKSWKNRKHIGLESKLDYYTGFIRDLAKERIVDFWFLLDQDKDIAAYIVYQFHGTLFAGHTTYDPDPKYRPFSPGILLNEAIIQYACEHPDIQRYDPLATPIDGGRPRHKTIWMTEPLIPTRNITIYKNSGITGLLVKGMRLKNRLRTLTSSFS